MSSNHRITVIQDRLKKAFAPSHLEVVDESDQHIGHAGHQGGGRHFAVLIAADCFKCLSRIDAHRQVYNLFSDMMPDQIHALRIKVLNT